jgi:nicotinate-nucleotide pyrophosphorylase
MPGKGGKEPDMAEEATATEQEQAEQAEQKVDNQTEATDWQAKYEAARAHSREWEKKAGRHMEIESSGGITIDTIRSYAEQGVDFVSVGALTHSYKSLDMSFKAVK